MKFNKISKYDIKIYLKKHAPLYISFLVCFLVGVLFGVVNSMSSESYLKLLTKDDKILFTFITGGIGSGSVFWKNLIAFITPAIIIFIINLNFYIGLLSYVFIAYQSSILMQTIFAVISTYGVSGVLNVLFVILPINLLYLAVLVFFSSACLKRSKLAFKNKNWLYDIKSDEFLWSIIIALVLILVVCFIGVIIVPIFLKSAIFVIF